MHGITEVAVSNFRSCQTCRLLLSDYTPLVGYNNAGKSNLIAAISWLLTGKALSASDFGTLEEPVTVEATIHGIDDELLQLLGDRHRGRIEEHCVDGILRIRRRQHAPSTRSADVKLDVWSADADDWVDNPNGIPGTISALLPAPIHIGAMEDASEDVAKSKSTSTIGRLLASVKDRLEENHRETIEGALKTLRDLMGAEGGSRAEELVEFDAQANAILAEFFPGLALTAHIPPPEFEDLFKTGTVKVSERAGAPPRDFDALGHGAQRSIQMALVRYRAQLGERAEAHPQRTMLLIDEPELYLHPRAVSVVRDALKTLGAGPFQVVFSTHSAQMVGLHDVADALMVRKAPEGGTYVLPTVRSAVADSVAENRSQAATLFDLSNASQVLFADRVIVAEGKTESRLLPSVFEAVLGRPMNQGTTALVIVSGSAGIPRMLKVLRTLGLRCCALTDLDFAFRHGVYSDLIDEDSPELAHCRDWFATVAEEKGIALAEDGLPKKGGAVSAEDAFNLLAASGDSDAEIRALHERLLDEGIWLWVKGSFEHHLGVDGKDEESWGEYAAALRSDGAGGTIADPDTVRAFLEWAEAR